MFYASRFVPALSILGLLAPACVDEATDPGAHEFRTTAGGNNCGTCTLNSPRGNDFQVPELNVAGVANEAGIRLMGLIDPNDYGRDLRINGDDLEAVDWQDHVVGINDDLVGWRIWLRDANDEDRFIHVLGHQSVTPEGIPGHPTSVFAMAYQDPDTGRFKNLCPEAENDPGATVLTVIGGERYREAADPVIDSPGWFTLACAEQAVHKMKLLGYSPSLPLDGVGTSIDQRKATLRMFRADYCGDGESHTEQGTLINRYNVGGTVGVQAAGWPFEAKWGPNGALCLSHQRIPELEVACAHKLPACETFTDSGFEWTTRVPPPPPLPPDTDTDTEGP